MEINLILEQNSSCLDSFYEDKTSITLETIIEET